MIYVLADGGVTLEMVGVTIAAEVVNETSLP